MKSPRILAIMTSLAILSTTVFACGSPGVKPAANAPAAQPAAASPAVTTAPIPTPSPASTQPAAPSPAAQPVAAGPSKAAPETVRTATAASASEPYILTTLDPPGSVLTQQYGINANGEIVGAYLDSALKLHGYLYSGGKFTVLDVPSDIAANVSLTYPSSINSAGDIVGYYRLGGEPGYAYHGFLLTKQGKWSKVENKDYLYTMPNSIMDDGTILGCVHGVNSAFMHGVILSKNIWSEYPPPYTTITMHNGAAVTRDGKMRIVGQTGIGDMPLPAYNGYILDNGYFIPFVVPNSTSTFAMGISPTGVVVGYYNDNSAAKLPHGFMVHPQGLPDEGWQFTTIDVPGAGRTILRGINAGGDLIGTYTTNASATSSTLNTWHGFVLSRTGR